jgi:uncharacterized cofD-like protein
MPTRNKKMRRSKVVVIGGGTGLSVMLRGLKHQALDLTAIVTVADDGGSSGRLREEMHIPPPGDVRNVIQALADAEPTLTRMLQYRFPHGTGLAGHSLGNLILAAITDITGDFVTGVRELSRVLAVRGRVLPAAAQAVVLSAELVDGSVVVGESQIPRACKKIKRVFLDPPEIAALPEAVEAIVEADAIVVGPGSLYTSILPNLIVPNIQKALIESQAVKIYVSNVMTQPGETDFYSVCDHLDAIEAHVGERLFEWVIVNDGEIPTGVLASYAEQHAERVVIDMERMKSKGYKVLADHLVKFEQYLRHDSDRLSGHIAGIIYEHRDRVQELIPTKMYQREDRQH